MRARILRAMHCVGLVMGGPSLRRLVIVRGISIQMKSIGLLKASQRTILSSKLGHGHIRDGESWRLHSHLARCIRIV